MKLYVCFSTGGAKPETNSGHPCGLAHHALREAGYDPEVVKSYGSGFLPAALNPTKGRRRAKELTGSHRVPVLELDDGTAVGGSQEIVAWAKAHPANG